MSNYKDSLEQFKTLFEKEHNERLSRFNLPAEKINLIKGYKFDKIYVKISTGQKIARYMVEHISGAIYGIKSWTQVNMRRQFGTLDTINDWDWSGETASPKKGTKAEAWLAERETKIRSTHKKRGRKPKASKLSKGQEKVVKTNE